MNTSLGASSFFPHIVVSTSVNISVEGKFPISLMKNLFSSLIVSLAVEYVIRLLKTNGELVTSYLRTFGDPALGYLGRSQSVNRELVTAYSEILISVLGGIWNTGVAIRDYRFLNKLLLFLHESSKLPIEKRLKLIDELEETTFQKEKINKLYATNFFRTRQTLQPLASTYTLDVDIYKDNDALIKKIKALQGNNNIVVAGHSNSVITLIKSLGAQINIETLTEEDYDYIFLVTIKGDKISLKTKHFGAKHHVTKI